MGSGLAMSLSGWEIRGQRFGFCLTNWLHDRGQNLKPQMVFARMA